MRKSNIVGSTAIKVFSGTALLIGVYLLTILLWDKGWMSTFSFSLSVLGIMVLFSSIPLYRRSMQQRNSLLEKLNTLEDVLSRYN